MHLSLFLLHVCLPLPIPYPRFCVRTVSLETRAEHKAHGSETQQRHIRKLQNTAQGAYTHTFRLAYVVCVQDICVYALILYTEKATPKYEMSSSMCVCVCARGEPEVDICSE